MSEYIIGRNPVMEALNSERKIKKVFIEDGELRGSINNIIKRIEKEGIPYEKVSKEKLNGMTESNRHQGIIAEVEAFKYSQLREVLDYAKDSGESPFIVILDQIEDPHNLGAIIRTANSAGAHGVIIPKHRAAGINQTVFRASAGAVNFTKIVMVTNLNRTIESLKSEGLWIYGADALGDNVFFEEDFNSHR